MKTDTMKALLRKPASGLTTTAGTQPFSQLRDPWYGEWMDGQDSGFLDAPIFMASGSTYLLDNQVSGKRIHLIEGRLA